MAWRYETERELTLVAQELATSLAPLLYASSIAKKVPIANTYVYLAVLESEHTALNNGNVRAYFSIPAAAMAASFFCDKGGWGQSKGTGSVGGCRVSRGG